MSDDYDLPDGAVHIPGVHIPGVNGAGLIADNQDAADELLEIAEANGRLLRARRAAQTTWDGGDAA